jgi:hypothetical protein
LLSQFHSHLSPCNAVTASDVHPSLHSTNPRNSSILAERQLMHPVIGTRAHAASNTDRPPRNTVVLHVHHIDQSSDAAVLPDVVDPLQQTMRSNLRGLQNLNTYPPRPVACSRQSVMPNKLPMYPLSVTSDEVVENSQVRFSTHCPIANYIRKFECGLVQAEGRQWRAKGGKWRWAPQDEINKSTCSAISRMDIRGRKNTAYECETIAS